MLVGKGVLPDWLRNKHRNTIALHGFDDNLCIFRCLAVHQGARIDRCIKEVK